MGRFKLPHARTLESIWYIILMNNLLVVSLKKDFFSSKWVYTGYVVIYKAFCLDVAQGRMNGAPNETRILSWMLASLVC